MEKTEALSIIKQVVDAALSAGIIKDIDSATKIAEAYNALASDVISVQNNNLAANAKEAAK